MQNRLSSSVPGRFQGGKREELIGITYNRLIRMDAGTGDAIKTWRFSNMKQWNVNWEIKMVEKPPERFTLASLDARLVTSNLGSNINCQFQTSYFVSSYPQLKPL